MLATDYYMENTINHWSSPYQDSRFHDGIRKAGLQTEVLITKNGDPIFFYGEDNQLVAWEVDCEFNPNDIPDGHKIYKYIHENGNTNSDNDTAQRDNYQTIALMNDQPRFGKRFKRNVIKAQNYNIPTSLKEVVSPDQINIALSQFISNPERRDNIEMEKFTNIVQNLAQTGILRCFVLNNETNDKIVGTAAVLINDTQANLRYYSADKNNNEGHILHYLLINHLFNALSMDIVDLSGYSSSNETDKKLLGINEFKKQIGGSIINFQCFEK